MKLRELKEKQKEGDRLVKETLKEKDSMKSKNLASSYKEYDPLDTSSASVYRERPL